MIAGSLDQELAKRIELAKREWESTVDTITEGLALFDSATLSIRRVNWPFARMFDSTPKKMLTKDIHQVLCGCGGDRCDVREMLLSRLTSRLETRRPFSDRHWSLSVYPISAISGSETHFKHNVVVLRDITEERLLQQRIIEAEKHALVVELADQLIDRINPTVEAIRSELSAISGHVVALREVLRRLESATQAGDETVTSGGYPNLAFKEIDDALRISMEKLDHLNEVVGCIDELEISSGRVLRLDS
jgi:PAS domain-containing protein